jgi:hypothetical protein
LQFCSTDNNNNKKNIMKKNIFLSFFVFTAFSAWSQDLNVTATSSVYITPTSYVYAGSSVDVVSGASLTIVSNATDSGSFLAPNGTVGGNITYERYVLGNKWYHVSAPVTTQDITNFATDPPNAVATGTGGNLAVAIYDNGKPKGSRWVYENSGNLETGGAFVTGKGYNHRRTANGVFTYTGEMSTGDVNVTIPLSPITGADSPNVSTAHLWALVGNPYPSFLPGNDAAALTNNLLKHNLGILDTSFSYILILTGTSGEHDIYNLSDISALHILPGQAFFVDPAYNNQTFTFPEAFQTPQPTPGAATLLRSSPNLEITLNLSNGSDTKKTILKYRSDTTTGLDQGYDAGTFDDEQNFAVDTHLISDSEGINFMIQCLPNTDYETLVVPVSVKAAANQTIAFSADISNLSTGLKVYLEDKVANTITDITTGSHQLTNTVALNGIGRFYLHTTESALSVDDLAGLGSTLNMYKTSNTNLRVTGVQQQGVALLKMYTTTGKQVLSNSFIIETVNDIALPNNLSKGIYIVNVVTNATKQTKKIIIE